MMLAAVSLVASAAQGAPDEIVKVRWRPTPLPKAFPDMRPCHGDRFFTPGTAELECRLTADGHVQACVVVSQQPADCDYGQAALSLVQTFQAMATLDGRTIKAGMRVRVPIRFQAPER